MGTDVQVGDEVGGAGRGRLGPPRNLEGAVGFSYVFAGLAVFDGEARLYQAHTAVGGDAQGWVIAEKRYLNPVV